MRKHKELDNLTKDCIRARKLGYSSYGKYKADHPNTKESEEPMELQEGTIQCHYCYGRFVPSRKDAKFCSTKCRERAFYLKKRSKEYRIVMV